MRIIIFFLTTIVCNFAFACGSDSEKREMSELLYKDTEMRVFVCAADTCSVDEFFEKIEFEAHVEQYESAKIDVCLVVPIFSATNSFTGVFAKNFKKFNLQFISYGTGILVGKSKNGIPTLTEGEYYDPSDSNREKNIYIWSKGKFVFRKTCRINLNRRSVLRGD